MVSREFSILPGLWARPAGARSEPSAARAYLLLHRVVAEERQLPKWGLLGRRSDARQSIAVAVK